MELLESAMAFAVVMIILSTIVTGVVEALLRFIRLRQETLTEMLTALLRKEALPRIEAALKDSAADAAAVAAAQVEPASLKAFVAELTANPLDGAGSGLFRRWFGRVDDLTPYSFMQRLAKTDLGRQLAEHGRDQLQPCLTDISRTYERYQAASREYFRKRAHIVTFIVSILLALALNVDGARVLLHLMNHPDARVVLIEQGEAASKANTEAQARVDRLLKDEKISDEDAKAFRDSLSSIGAEVADLRENRDLPIGPERWPYCFGEAAAQECGDGAKSHGSPWSPGGLIWLLKVLATGVLIGLGGPFWYKIFMSLSQIAQAARSIRGSREVVAEPADGKAPAGGAQSPEKLTENFRIAAGK